MNHLKQKGTNLGRLLPFRSSHVSLEKSLAYHMYKKEMHHHHGVQERLLYPLRSFQLQQPDHTVTERQSEEPRVSLRYFKGEVHTEGGEGGGVYLVSCS